MLDLVPAQLRVKVVRRPRYACWACEEAVVQAPAPERPISGGMASEALLAHVLVAKYADFLPLYRQAQIFARQGIALDRSTLCDWVGRACWWLEPLWRLLRRHVMASTRIFADDTLLPVLDPGRGRTKTGRLWGYAIDDRSWNGGTPPAVVYLYAEDRRGEHPAAHLAEFQGVLQVDGYGGFKRLLESRPPGAIRLAFCWAHCRRRFYEIHQATGSPLAEEALRRIGELYAIEAAIRGRPAEDRRTTRQERSKRLVDALHAWLTVQLGRISGKSALAEAIRYALRHWPGLVLFLEDGRLELDNNTVERAIRPIALGRKNSLFAGSDGGARHWALVASLVATAKLNGVEPLAWLIDVLERMVSGRTKAHELERLLPWAWKAERLAGAINT
jgi:transposase